MRIGYLISSNKAYFESTYLVLNRSLLSCGIEQNNILWFVGGHEENKKVNDHIYQVDHNSFDFTALIGFFSTDAYLEETFSHIFLLHDTCEAGPEFKTKAETFDNSLPYLSTCRIFTMGMFAISFLKEQKDFLNGLKNLSKQKAMKYEMYFYDNYGQHSYQKVNNFPSEYVFHDSRDVYGHGYARRVCYLPYLDLYKYPRQGTETIDTIL